MEVAELIDRLAGDGPLLADAAARAGWDAAVAPCPGWTVRDLVTHTGGVHRWAAAVVDRALADDDDETGRAVGTGPREDELLDWFRQGHAALVRTLREAPDDLACFTFLPAPSPLAFWARRQAHETAIHRVDAETAAGAAVGAAAGAAAGAAIGNAERFDAAFAQDGMAEVLLGFGRRRGRELQESVTLSLRPTDDGAPWHVTLGPDGVAARTPDPGPAEATVTGTSADLYCWLWNRPATVTITGDAAAAARWGVVRVRWA